MIFAKIELMGKTLSKTIFSTRLIVLLSLMLGLVAIMVLLFLQSHQETLPAVQVDAGQTVEPKAPTEPTVATSEVLTGLSHPWEIAFLPDKTMIFTERSGVLSTVKNGVKKQIATVPNVYKVNEAGLTGLAIDADFKSNRYIYTCFNAQTDSGLDVRLVRWKLGADLLSLSDRNDIVTNIPSNANGYHSGCRIKSAKDGTLWVGTGDAYRGGVAQSPTSLGGKILHVTRDGMPTGSNLPAPFDPRIFSYGHRNVQGIMLYERPTANGVYGLSIEHGSDVDDEVNLIKKGNFGWAPTKTYVQAGVPMTDLKKFPDALSAVWSSGGSTIAPSGGVILSGEKWGTYEGAVVMAVLKGKEVRVIKFKKDYTLDFQKTVVSDVGRVRTAVQGPDGNLYISTDNGTNDKIIKLTPQLGK